MRDGARTSGSGRLENPRRTVGKMHAAIAVGAPSRAGRAGARHRDVGVGVDDRIDASIGAVPGGRVDGTIDIADDISRLRVNRAAPADIDAVGCVGEFSKSCYGGAAR